MHSAPYIFASYPEGLATFTSALKYPHIGIEIAIHNITDGIATSVKKLNSAVFKMINSSKRLEFVFFPFDV